MGSGSRLGERGGHPGLILFEEMLFPLFDELGDGSLFLDGEAGSNSLEPTQALMRGRSFVKVAGLSCPVDKG